MAARRREEPDEDRPGRSSLPGGAGHDSGRMAGGSAAGPDRELKGARVAGRIEPAPAAVSPARGQARSARTLPALRAAQPARSPDQVVAACDGVIDIVAVLFNVSGRDIRGPGRSTFAVSRVRQIAMYAAHVTLGFTMGSIGQGFGRDRTTVLHACHQIEDLREDDEFDAIVARVEQVVAAAFGGPAGQG